MAEVHPDPSTFGQPVVAPVAAPAPVEPAPSVLQDVEVKVEEVAHEVEQLVHPEQPAPAAPAAPAPVEAPAVAEVAAVASRVEDGWHVLSGLSNGVTLPPSRVR
jgi:hypothetical protein